MSGLSKSLFERHCERSEVIRNVVFQWIASGYRHCFVIYLTRANFASLREIIISRKDAKTQREKIDRAEYNYLL